MQHDFDARARSWDSPSNRARAAAIATAVRAALPQADALSALEYGSGTGLIGLALADRFARLTLADTSDGMLAVAREKIASADFDHVQAVRLDLTTTDVRHQRYDVVISAMVLHHVPEPPLLLERWHSILNPGGRLFLADLDEEDGSFHEPGAEVHHGFNRDTLRHLLERAGFTVASIETVHTIEKDDRAYPVFLVVADRSR